MLPDGCFENVILVKQTTSDLLDTLFSLQPCLGIYDPNFLRTIKMREQLQNFGNANAKPAAYEIDSRFLLTNYNGKQIKETVKSINPQGPCEGLVLQPRAERCLNCTFLVRNIRLFQETPSDNSSFDTFKT